MSDRNEGIEAEDIAYFSGRANAFQESAEKLMNRAALLFTNGRDADARLIRESAQEIQAYAREASKRRDLLKESMRIANSGEPTQ